MEEAGVGWKGEGEQGVVGVGVGEVAGEGRENLIDFGRGESAVEGVVGLQLGIHELL